MQKEQQLVDNGSTPGSTSTSRSAEGHQLKREQPLGKQETSRSEASDSAANIKEKGEALPRGSKGNMWTADQLGRHLQGRFKVKGVKGQCIYFVVERKIPKCTRLVIVAADLVYAALF